MTEEEKKERKRAAQKKYRETHKEQIREYSKKFREEHPEVMKERWRKYLSNEENRQRRHEYQKKYREEKKEHYKKYRELNKEMLSSKSHERYIKNREKKIQKKKDYYNTLRGRAVNLLSAYKKMDLLRGFECTITPEYIETEIFTKSCVYCRESDWKKLGCDRIDNDKGHTPDNVVCSCGECNNDRNRRKMSVEEYKEYKKKG